MDFNLKKALQALDEGASFTVANRARPASSYKFATILPEEPRTDYYAAAGNMTFEGTMAGLVGMDSRYPPGGKVRTREWMHKVAKIANHIPINEETMREIQATLDRLLRTAGRGRANDRALEMIMNFFDLMVVQPHLDTAEWMRGQALFTGMLNWTFNDKTLKVNYGIPSGNLFPMRSGASGYGGASSTLWADLRLAKRKLKKIRRAIMHSDTKEMILFNREGNELELTDENEANNTFAISRIVGTSERRSTDPRESRGFEVYDLEASAINPNDPDGDTIKIPFCPRGGILLIGEGRQRNNIIGEGSVAPDPNTPQLGFTHLAPTIESQTNTPGRWGRVYVPQERQWEIAGEAVTNVMPVIEDPTQIVVLTTEMT